MKNALDTILALEAMMRRAHIEIRYWVMTGSDPHQMTFERHEALREFIDECHRFQLDLLRPWDRTGLKVMDIPREIPVSMLRVNLADTTKFSVLGDTFAMRLGEWSRVPAGWLLVDADFAGEMVQLLALLQDGALQFTGEVWAHG